MIENYDSHILIFYLNFVHSEYILKSESRDILGLIMFLIYIIMNDYLFLPYVRNAISKYLQSKKSP